MEFIFPKILSSYSKHLVLLNQQYQTVEEAIEGSPEAQDKIFNPEFLETLENAQEDLRQAFATFQHPLLNVATENMYDNLTALVRLVRTHIFDREYYYHKAPDEYKKAEGKLESERLYLERYEKEHSPLFK